MTYEYTVYESGNECTVVTLDTPATLGSTILVEGYTAQVTRVDDTINVVHIKWVF